MRRIAIFLIIAIALGKLVQFSQGDGKNSQAYSAKDLALSSIPSSTDVHEKRSPAPARSGMSQALAKDIARRIDYVFIGNGEADKGCDIKKQLSQFPVTQTKCVSESQWEKICDASIGIDASAAARYGALYAAMGMSVNSADALRSVAFNNGVNDEHVIWDHEKKICEITFRLSGMYDGSTVNESFRAKAKEIYIGETGAGLILDVGYDN